VRVQSAAGRIHATQDLRRAFGEHDAGLRQPDAASDPLHELRAGLRLEPRDVVADRRLRVVQLARGGRDRTVAGDGGEDAQTVEVEHSSTVSMGDLTNKHWTA
jgi:hypothetical protein